MEARLADMNFWNSEFLDTESLELTFKTYGGRSCTKLGIEYCGEMYLLKFPGNLREKGMKNVQLSYSNSPVCEYIGSHIYQMLGMKVHDTLLAKRNGKLVVLCKDFAVNGNVLQPFSELKTTFEPAFLKSDGSLSNGEGARLSEILLVLKNHYIYQAIPNAVEMFWRMFVIDAFIGNPDRNNDNFGVLYNEKERSVQLSPIYDNGNCLYDKWDDEKMVRFMSSEKEFEGIAWKAFRCYHMDDNDKKLNPFYVIRDAAYAECTAALHYVVERIDMELIKKFIISINVLSNVQKEFYTRLLFRRYEVLKELERGII